jgi:serine protease Do
VIGQVFRFETGNVLRQLADSVVMIGHDGGQGSGVIWAPGLVVTNHHVAGARKVQVLNRIGLKVTGSIIASDPDEDLALITVPWGKPDSPGVADSDRVEIGQLALAMGHPLGNPYEGSVGIVSGIESSTWMGRMRRKMLQLDLSLAPGSSGGPIVTEDGRIMGLACMIASPGIGLAIPSNSVEAFVRQATRLRKAG